MIQKIAMNQTLMLPQSIAFIFLMLTTSSAVDIIAVNEIIRDGETVVSKNGTFELGFFSPGSSEKRYLGIWYKKISPRTIVWVANRENPLNSTSGVLMFNHEQLLLLLNGSSIITWSSIFSVLVKGFTPVALLLDTGNFVIKDRSDSSEENFVWQSFDYPGNTLLPGMKFGKKLRVGRETYLTSWRSADDLSPGGYSFKWVMNEYPQAYKMKGSIIEIRLGPWDGFQYAGFPIYKSPFYTYKVANVINQKEAYFVYMFNSTTFLERHVLTPDGRYEFWHHVTGTEGWIQDMVVPLDLCDSYGLCGPYGICSTATSLLCGCLKGFEPTKEWRLDFWVDGCQRKIALDCGPKEGFVKFPEVKLPDTQGTWFHEHMTLRECEVSCKKNCSCTAYANPYVNAGGSGCLLWFGNLIDVRVYPQAGQDLYVRVATSELLKLQSGSDRKKRVVITLSVFTSVVVVVLGLVLARYAWSKRIRRSNVDTEGSLIKLIDRDHNGSSDMENIQLLLFRLSTIASATNNFSIDNKLGEGGFGSIYKFWAGDSNNSLLSWPQRFHIIHGIARGLLYLHQDSRLRIVHRDLKAGNILLDADMNPKISDFGLARMFKGHESEANTEKVVGTLGYISPEYAVRGLFSVKSDIFSFGVLVLEIVSGKKNRGFTHEDHSDNLLGHAWRLYREGKSLTLVDSSLGESWVASEVLRSINIGLLCVQREAEDRPSMSSVVLMLGGEGTLPSPKQPGFFIEGSGSALITPSPPSINGLTMTQTDGR